MASENQGVTCLDNFGSINLNGPTSENRAELKPTIVPTLDNNNRRESITPTPPDVHDSNNEDEDNNPQQEGFEVAEDFNNNDGGFGPPTLQMVYQGSKYITRQNVQLDFKLYEETPTHQHPYHRIQINCYNTQTDSSYPPLYINADLARKQLDLREEIQEDEDIITSNAKHVNPNIQAVLEYEKDLGDFILQRVSYIRGIKTLDIPRDTNEQFESLLVPGPTKVDDPFGDRRPCPSAMHDYHIVEQKTLEAKTKNSGPYLATKARATISAVNDLLHIGQKRTDSRRHHQSIKEIHEPKTSSFKRVGSRILNSFSHKSNSPQFPES